MRRTCLAALLAVFSFATAASAEVCLLDDDNDTVYRFAKLKLPKKVGDAAPLTGVGFTLGIPVSQPVVGAVTRLDEDSWIIGFTRYGVTCVVTGELDAALAGSFNYDCNFNNTIDETVPVEEIECDGI